MTMDEKKALKIQRIYDNVRLFLMLLMLLAAFFAVGAKQFCN